MISKLDRNSYELIDKQLRSTMSQRDNSKVEERKINRMLLKVHQKTIEIKKKEQNNVLDRWQKRNEMPIHTQAKKNLSKI